MSDRELKALTTLGFDELARATGGIGAIHQAVAGRVFRAVRPGAALVEPIHDGITRAVHRGLGGGTRAIGFAAGTVAGMRTGEAISRSRNGSAVIAAIAGLTGDALEAQGSPLAQPMAVRVGGAPIPPDAGSLAHAFPEATPQVVVFLHGLMETEFSWGMPETYGTRLARELGCTPVQVR